ncbi:hypothetical protein [Litoribaculum gwangyangense]|uniref:Uncharacterized protein n=1 Tax=Litoribaculum gwangyangense TaxID=1130722 RepID=A0ABP9CYF8_9FLAO
METQVKVTLFILIVMTLSIQSQNTYLKITEDDKISVSYPPGTKFELKDNLGYIILKESDTELVYKIDSDYTLEVFPTYKKDKDVYNLTNGKIELVSNADYMNAIKHKKGAYQSYGVSLDKASYMDSTVKKGETNTVLEFSNGVVFKYTDGNVSAIWNDEEVEVKGKYLIYSDAGVVKISYNPKNKEMWWTYEPNEK